jgi:hypothetical protein
MLRKTFVTAALTTGLVLSSAGIASAHECFIAKRSATGTAAATHSANWHQLTLTGLFSKLPPFLPQLTQAQVVEAVALAEAQGIPSSVALFGHHTVPVSQDEWSPKAADGRGVDHFFSAYGARLIGIVMTGLGGLTRGGAGSLRRSRVVTPARPAAARCSCVSVTRSRAPGQSRDRW